MLRTISLENFRAFRRFSMSGLGRVNLLVGTNNCGKTSVLEAIGILASQGQIGFLWQALYRRGEYWYNDNSQTERVEVDVCHLFHGHELGLDVSFEIASDSTASHRTVNATIQRRSDKSSGSPAPDSDEPTKFVSSQTEYTTVPWRIDLQLNWMNGTRSGDRVVRLPVTRRGGLTTDMFDIVSQASQSDQPPVRFVAPQALTRDEVVTLFESIVLTPEEDTVIEALRSIEPSIERIAPLGGSRHRGDRGGMVVKLTGNRQRLPIGSMGDGIWRMLGIALSLVRARGGILLVDEIDTGLHYSVMGNMWKLVREAAARLDVQVFATTHSRDCWESLAAVSRLNAGPGSEVSIQRIERGKETSVAFSEQEMVIAAERGIEVR